MLSQTAQYALRAVLAIAAGRGEAVGAGVLAQRLGLPQNYLSKTLHQLARAGLLESTRGKSGGFRLARPAERITLRDIVGLFDDISARRTCLLGNPQCSDVNPCPLHHKWKAASERNATFFRETTIGELL